MQLLHEKSQTQFYMFLNNEAYVVYQMGCLPLKIDSLRSYFSYLVCTNTQNFDFNVGIMFV